MHSGRQCTGWGVDTGGAKYGNCSYYAKFPEAKIPEASFPTANLFTANFPRTNANILVFCPPKLFLNYKTNQSHSIEFL